MIPALRRSYADLHLRRNPFGAPKPEAWAELAVVRTEAPLAFLRGEGARVVQVLGESGRGKSTTLRALTARCEGARYVYAPPRGPIEVPWGARVGVVDEVERLARGTRRAMWRSGRWIVSAHRDLRAEIERGGARLFTVEVQGLRPPDLAEMIERRITWARSGPGPSLEAHTALVEGLAAAYKTDARSAVRMLYHLAAIAPGPGPIPWPPPASLAGVGTVEIRPTRPTPWRAPRAWWRSVRARPSRHLFMEGILPDG